MSLFDDDNNYEMSEELRLLRGSIYSQRTLREKRADKVLAQVWFLALIFFGGMVLAYHLMQIRLY